MRRVALAVTVVLLSVAAARASAAPTAWPPLRTAGPFLVREVHQKIAGHWARAWASLYPAHQRVAPRALYVACERKSSFPAPLRSVRAVATRKALVHVAGVGRPVAGVAVTLDVVVGSSRANEIEFLHTFHLIPVNGRWRWILSRARYQLYASQGCSAGPAV